MWITFNKVCYLSMSILVIADAAAKIRSFPSCHLYLNTLLFNLAILMLCPNLEMAGCINKLYRRSISVLMVVVELKRDRMNK